MSSVNWILGTAVLALIAATSTPAGSQGHREVDLYSSSDGGGELLMDLGPLGPQLQVFESLCAGGECLYTSVEIGIVSPDIDVPEESFFALGSGTHVSLEVVAIDAAVSVKLGQQIADAPGDVLDFGIAPGIHVHPEWQVLAPEGVEGDFPLSVVLKPLPPSPYANSQQINLMLTNRNIGPPPVETVGPIPEVALTRPRGRGDQLAFYYDARDGFTSFLNIANEGETELDVKLSLYGPVLTQPFDVIQSIPARGSRTIDVAALRQNGLNTQLGVAFATAISESGAALTNGALAGTFTVANLATQSAWGGPAPARFARQIGDGAPVRPPNGTVVDGENVVFEQFSPSNADLSVYYDPATLQPPSQGGNQIVFVAFADVAASSYAAVARGATWTYTATRNSGAPLGSSSRSFAGVQVLDLASLIGSSVNGSAGRVGLSLDEATAPNRLVFFQESLGTFATGYLLPMVQPVDAAPTPRPSPGLPEAVARGDQLLLYYDARDGFTTFLNLANEGDAALDVKLQMYGASLATPFETQVALPAHGTRTLDVRTLREGGLPAGAGLAVATAVGAKSVPFASRVLAGNFTVANLGTNSAWGAPAAARTAVRLDNGSVVAVAPGTPIDGTNVFFDQISPRTLDLSVYYDPNTLEPVDRGGNQLVFISFDDVAGQALGIASAEVAWGLSGTRSNGDVTTAGTHTTSGVEVSNLNAVAGTDLGGSAGRLRFAVRPPSAENRIIYFVESLGTFATGYALPAEE